jgi:hypothetical protein
VRRGGGSAIIRRVRGPSARRLRRPSLPLPALLLGLAAAQTACLTVPTRTTVFNSEGTEVILRGEKRGTTPIDRGFQHPASIAPVRMAHILSRIDLRREGDDDREPAIPLESLFLIAEGMSKGLEAADSSQEVVVQSIYHKKKWGVFDHQYLTSLLCYMKEDLLYIHISRSFWKIPPRREDRLPETHVGDHPLDFRLVIDPGMALVDEQSVAVNWRDPVFRRPTRTRVTPGGKVVRRTILMEDESQYEDNLTDLTPDQLRALADLEEERRAGRIPEAEYNARRSRIMRGDDPSP